MSDKLPFFAFVMIMIALMMSLPAFAKEFKSSNDFVAKAAVGNLFEVKSSQLALKRSQDADVKAFAQQMIDDHGKTGNDLKAAVAESKMTVKDIPMKLDTKHQKEYNKLNKASAADFNKDYIAAQEKAHKETIALFESYSEEGDSTALKAFATNTLLALNMHKEHVDGLSDKQ